MLFTKNEGVVLAAALIIALAAELVVERSRNRLGAALRWLVAMPMAATLPWFVFRATLPKVHEDYGARIAPSVFVENLARVPEVLAAFASYFGDTEDWSLFWPLLGVALLIAAVAPADRASRFFVLGIALVLSAYGYVYVVTPWNLRDLMDVSANRLLLQVFGICVLFVADATTEKAR
jgi:hypothetical protein